MRKRFIRSTLSVFIASTLMACGGGSDGGNTGPSVSQSEFTITLSEDTSVTESINATDNDNDDLAFGVSESPQNGTLQVQQDGSFTYTPNQDFFGNDTAQISVSDSIETVSVTLSFTVENVNDLPEIVTSQVAVSSAGETTGQIEAIDADGDALTFAVVTQPSVGVVTLDSSTGAFTFEQNELENVDASFEVSVIDGIGDAVLATISLTPSYASNSDKIAYYYASDLSHLAQAEAFITRENDQDNVAITDADITADIYAELAAGYTEAGFADLAESNAIGNIIDRPTRASAYLVSAEKLDAQGNITLANEFRNKAIRQYNAYIAEIGISNIRPGDASFYLSVVRSYVNAGQLEQASDLLSVIRIYADANHNDNEPMSSAYGFFLQAVKTYVEEQVDAYLNSPTQANYDAAFVGLNFQQSLALQASYQERSGEQYYQRRAFYLVDATRSAFYLSLTGSAVNTAEAEEKAKELLAQTLSLYTNVDYDINYTAQADEFAEATLRRYPTGVGLLAGIFNALYPEVVQSNSDDGFLGNLPLKLVFEEEGANDFDTKRAYRDHYAFQLFNDARSGRALDSTILDLETLFTTTYDDTEYAVEALVEQDANDILDKRAAWLLYYGGFTSQAQKVLNEALRIMGTTPYLEDVRYNANNVLDDQGCLRLVKLEQQFSADNTLNPSSIEGCTALLTTYYSDNTYVSDANRVSALLVGASIYQLADNKAQEKATLDNAWALASSLEDTETRLEHRIEVTNTVASLGYLNDALAYFTESTDDVLATLDTLVDLTERVDMVNTIVDELEFAYEPDSENSFTGTYQLFEAVKRQAGIHSDYASTIAALNSKAMSVQQTLLTASSDFADNENLDLYEVFIEQFSWLGFYENATELAQSSIYTDADRNSLFAAIATQAAQQDDFPAFSIANVDTDLDGLPNFFLDGVSDAAIQASGLIADDDADNDGIPDSEDLNPLVKE